MAKDQNPGDRYHLCVPLPDELLEVLACPNCHRRLRGVGGEEALECAEDRLRFPIVDGIPVMLLDQATSF
ncbi:MAG TPA: Trm112 family protein [Chloroflexota bacterium]|jgi:uncharacterized protein YbaR (Trm112 family)